MTNNYVSKYRGSHAESTKESVCLPNTVHFAGSDRDDNSRVPYDSEFEEVEYDVRKCLVFCSHFSCSNPLSHVINLCGKHTVYLHNKHVCKQYS